MSFRFINPGYSKLIQIRDWASYLGDTVDTTKSRSGGAYSNTRDTGNLYQFSNLPENGEYWVKLDFYYASANIDHIYIKEYANQRSGLDLILYSNGAAKVSYIAGKSTYTLLDSADTPLTGLKMGSINTIWIHVKWGEAGVGFMEFQINNKRFEKIQDLAFPAETSNFRYLIYGGKIHFYFSSVIISDEEISPYERVVALPVASTTTDMSAREGGGYIASDTSQTLLQAVDTISLADEYGSDAKVTGIALVGNPAYEVDEVIGKLTSLIKSGGTLSEHETIQLSNASDSMIVSSFSTEMTVAELSGLQFGWKASE